ncbi:MAG: hypothetical protein HZA90_17835 [Verrucomicrobia bacterium]|nr:hypothetical protein [Verrucomicrobiota bacterium]
MKAFQLKPQNVGHGHYSPAALSSFPFLFLQSNKVVFALLTALTTFVQAQSYSVDWFTIDDGGGASTGGVYSLSGTIGQPDAGTMSGGNFTLEGGFWGLIAAVVTDTNAPKLMITCPAPNTVVISWPRPAEGWVLEHTDEITSAPGPWPHVQRPCQTNATTISVSYPFTPETGNVFFRLKKP